MPGLLEGKVLIVTGGGGGIGRAAALAMSREGARVAVADLVAATAENTVSQIKAAGGDAAAITCDVTDESAVKAMVRETRHLFGRLDGAFNNAGVAPSDAPALGKKTAEWSTGLFDRMIAVNLRGVWLCMKEEIIDMEQHGGGVIINNASVAGLGGMPMISGYVAAKHGVIGLTKTAALEYDDAHIRVNAVCPGFIGSDMTESMMRRFSAMRSPRKRFRRSGEPGEIAEMVVFLCSDRASFVNGAVYAVDGGYMAG